MNNHDNSRSIYKVNIIQGTAELNSLDDNVDVEVVFESGKRYIATFFTLKNIQRLMEVYEETGECRAGMYFWASNMIIVRELSEQIIRDTIDNLILEEEFEGVFSGPFTN